MAQRSRRPALRVIWDGVKGRSLQAPSCPNFSIVTRYALPHTSHATHSPPTHPPTHPNLTHILVRTCSPCPHLRSCTTHVSTFRRNTRKTLVLTRDICIFFFASETALKSLGHPLWPHRSPADVWQVTRQPSNIPALHFFSHSSPFPCQAQLHRL